MKKRFLPTGIAIIATAAALYLSAGSRATAAAGDWALNMTAIESCSCPMFCQCYFSTKPAGHSHHGGEAEHYCRFNMAWKVNNGNYGKVKLDGALFWIAGDLGGDFSEGNTDWAVVTFDPGVTAEQREGLATILPQLFPVKWNSFNVASDAKVEWKADKDRAHARLGGGQAAEVILVRQAGNTDDSIVIHNLKYWGAPRHDGFVLMPNELNAYRLGDKAFETKGTNGFMITVDVNSKDAARAGGM